MTCLIPGHDQPGHELYAEALEVHDDPYEDEFAGNCAYTSQFAYSSGD